jgi:uncharacterized protein (TIGR02001 family)
MVLSNQKSLRQTVLLSCFAVAVLPSYVLAQDGSVASELNLSGAVTFTTQYISRGLSQSDEKPALQGTIQMNHDSGFYAGLWGSNVNFNDGDEASVEVDVYGGYNGKQGNWSYGIGGIYYAYPGADDDLDYDFVGIPATLGYDIGVARITAGLQYFPDYFASSGTAFYSSVGVNAPLPYDFSIAAAAGHQSIEDEGSFGVPEYTDWSFKLGYDYQNLNVTLGYFDTDLSKAECASGCDERISLSLTAKFDSPIQ